MEHSKTSIYRALIYRVPRFTWPKVFPQKKTVHVSIDVKCTPIYRVSQFTMPFFFRPRGQGNRGVTVNVKIEDGKTNCQQIVEAKNKPYELVDHEE